MRRAAPVSPKSWHLAYRELPLHGMPYSRFIPGPRDVEVILKFYSQAAPIEGHEICDIEAIYNPGMNQSFSIALQQLNAQTHPVFAVKWQGESYPEWRRVLMDALGWFCEPYKDPDYPNVNLTLTWHGANPAAFDSIFKTGYSLLDDSDVTDPGFFGRGFYGSLDAAYSHRAYAKEAPDGTKKLLLNWTAFYSAYPAIDGDRPKLEGKGSYKNYDAHYCPVKPEHPSDPNEQNYFLLAPNDTPTYHELVVFQKTQMIPRYIVTFRPVMIPYSITLVIPTTLYRALFHPSGFNKAALPKRPVDYSVVAALLQIALDAAFAKQGHKVGLFKTAKSPLSPAEVEREEARKLAIEANLRQQQEKAAEEARQVAVDCFVTHVARGEQDEAERMLKENRALADGRGHAVEHCGREFRDLTGFQYALWALDWHMWKMIILYMDEGAIKEQLASQEALTTTQGHGVHFDFGPLLKAYDTYLSNHDAWCKANNWDAMQKCWIDQVGGAQQKIPAHVAQEYCTPEHPFDPMPDFTADRLTRLAPKLHLIDRWNFPHHIMIGISEPERVFGRMQVAGGGFHVALAGWGDVVVSAAMLHRMLARDSADRAAMSQFFKTRTSQLEALKHKIYSSPPIQGESLAYRKVADAYKEERAMEEGRAEAARKADRERKEAEFRRQQEEMAKKARKAEVDRFVTCVARGEQAEAETMLKTNPTLVLGRGNAVEHCGREFKDITGFQYALWALDWHMWEMFLSYLDRLGMLDSSIVDVQLADQERLTTSQGFGAHFDFAPLLRALEEYNPLYDDWYRLSVLATEEAEAYHKKKSSLFKSSTNAKIRMDDANTRRDEAESRAITHWIHQVGGAQRQLPAHIAQEYLHHDLPFDPATDFFQKSLGTRTEVDVKRWLSAPKCGKDPCTLGVVFAWTFRPSSHGGVLCDPMCFPPPSEHVREQVFFLRRLYEARTSQLTVPFTAKPTDAPQLLQQKQPAASPRPAGGGPSLFQPARTGRTAAGRVALAGRTEHRTLALRDAPPSPRGYVPSFEDLDVVLRSNRRNLGVYAKTAENSVKQNSAP